MSRFRLARGGRHDHEPWFHLGTLEIDTTLLFVGLSVVGILTYAFAGSATFNADGTLGGVEGNLMLHAYAVVHHARFWTLLTWPFAYQGVSLLDVLALLVLWWFGRDLEHDLLGRRRWALMLAIWTIVLGAVTVGLYVATGDGYVQAGPQLLEMIVVLAWIAEWPTRAMMLNIPAWIVGVVILAIQIINYLGQRSWTALEAFLIGIVLCGWVARQFGMLSAYPWVPKLFGGRPRPHRRPSQGSRSRRGGPNLRSVPTGSAGRRQRAAPQARSADDDRMNQLLDKIHAQGIDALSTDEQGELDRLRLRRQT
ncbi:MAG: hypothetical protein JO147_10665 [Actinobacteria bacterium]|nr:hypothetical protein [Actinomycetota bacterium]